MKEKEGESWGERETGGERERGREKERDARDRGWQAWEKAIGAWKGGRARSRHVGNGGRET